MISWSVAVLASLLPSQAATPPRAGACEGLGTRLVAGRTVAAHLCSARTEVVEVWNTRMAPLEKPQAKTCCEGWWLRDVGSSSTERKSKSWGSGGGVCDS